MSDQMNGNHPDVAQRRPPTVAEVRAFMRDFINPAIVCTINGLLLSLQQMGPEEILPMTCELFGRMIGSCAATGDLAPMLRLRRDCRERFLKGLESVPPSPQAGVAAPPPG